MVRFRSSGLALVAQLALWLAMSCGAPDDDAEPWGEGGEGGTGGVAPAGAGGGELPPLCIPKERLIVRWQPLAGSAEPGPRSLHAVGSGARTLVFGGVRAGLTLPDAWTFDADSETFRRAAEAPPSRAGHAMASTGDAVLLYGGVNDAGLLGDTWLWSDGWSQPCEGSGCELRPKARSHHAMAFEADAARVVLFGGSDGEALGDTWTWQALEGWQPLCIPAHAGTDGTGGASDEPSGAAGAGSECGPSARSGHTLSFDEPSETVVLFGGSDGSADFDDLWSLREGRWSRLEVEGDAGPGPRSGHAAAFDPSTELTLVFGGTTDGLLVSSDIWGYSSEASRWYRAEQSESHPSARTHAVVFTTGSGVVLQGGEASGELGDAWIARTEFSDGTELCACIDECVARCGQARRELCQRGCEREDSPSSEECDATGVGGASSSDGGEGGLGGGGGGQPPDADAGAAGGPDMPPEPTLSECQNLWGCCASLTAQNRRLCRETASADDGPVCDSTAVLCQSLQATPEADNGCMQLSGCCPSLAGNLKNSCIAALAGTAANCAEFEQGGFCPP